MIKIKEVEIQELKEEWQNKIKQFFYEKTKLTYCQTWEWNYQIYKYYKEKFYRKYILGNFIYIYIYEDDDLKLIAPISYRSNKATIIGKGCGQNYYDFIYGNGLDDRYFLELLKYLKKKNIKILDIPLIREESSLFKFIKNSNYKHNLKETKIVKLNYNYSSFEEYFKNLSKSTRQNIRTAYNRMEKDNIDYKYFVKEKDISSNEARKMMEFYVKRHDTIKKGDTLKENIIFYLRKLFLGEWQNDKVVYYSMTGNNNHKLYTLYLNNELAAYYYGLIYPYNKISFKHVCINNKYRKYSPGMILAMEILKRDSEKYDCFDFTTGVEDYKYKLGCCDEKCFGVRIFL